MEGGREGERRREAKRTRGASTLGATAAGALPRVSRMGACGVARALGRVPAADGLTEHLGPRIGRPAVGKTRRKRRRRRRRYDRVDQTHRA